MEKKLFVMAVAVMMATASVNAQEEKAVDAYFTADEMPDMRLFMPGPPDSTSVAFANDVSRYFWGKEMRMDPERADQVRRDGVYGLATILEEFEDAFGMRITQEDTPEIYKVLLEGTATCDSICKYPKIRYGRTRPYHRFNEHTLVPEYEEELNPHKSFPSGHSLLGWSSALLMMEINPDRANEILARGSLAERHRSRQDGSGSGLCQTAYQRPLPGADEESPRRMEADHLRSYFGKACSGSPSERECRDL